MRKEENYHMSVTRLSNVLVNKYPYLIIRTCRVNLLSEFRVTVSDIEFGKIINCTDLITKWNIMYAQCREKPSNTLKNLMICINNLLLKASHGCQIYSCFFIFPFHKINCPTKRDYEEICYQNVSGEETPESKRIKRWIAILPRTLVF